MSLQLILKHQHEDVLQNFPISRCPFRCFWSMYSSFPSLNVRATRHYNSSLVWLKLFLRFRNPIFYSISAFRLQIHLSADIHQVKISQIEPKSLQFLNYPVSKNAILAAIKALEVGVSGIVVSNHGARQLDYSPATISVLEEVGIFYLYI